MIFQNGHWRNVDGSTATVEQLQDIADGLEMELQGQVDFRYSHDEIESACGGEVALEIRRKVLERRARMALAAVRARGDAGEGRG